MHADIKYKKLKDTAIIPSCGSSMAAGSDLYACLDETVIIMPGETKPIGTGLSFELPINWFAGIFARSGLATKQGLRPANCVGVCDADYRGEYIVPLYNDSNEPRIIVHGERIAQMILLPYMHMKFIEENELSCTERGEGGFGSTGK